jgi:hypothetical protein
MCNENSIYFTRVKYITACNWMSEVCYDLVIRPDRPNVKSCFVNFVDVVKPGPVVAIRVRNQYFKVPMIRTTREMDKCIYQLAVLGRTESESYVTTDGQSASLSWNKAPILVLRPDFY